MKVSCRLCSRANGAPVSVLAPSPFGGFRAETAAAAAAAGNVKTGCLTGHYIDRTIRASRNNNS